ncbi:nucleoside diphosphate kinase Ndk1 [Mycoemilia scoparia]|uniref:Nucleoside diphosphate kinase n=1 Tax=Mycoemilia scoparia TaxID=417184 RepID=A0A9W8DN77_9FUNG|nr:nucleoside diphosphate kinase Ndk1 [Mycoemilia scoparia]
MFSRSFASALRSTSVLRNKAVTRGFANQARRSAASTKSLYGYAAALAVAGSATFAALSMDKKNNAQNVIYSDSQVPIHGKPGTVQERTFIAVKPDGVQRGLVSEVISRFERRGYKLVGLKLLVPPTDLVKQHYADLSSKPFFNGLVDYMTNGKAPVVGMVWEGPDVIKQGRAMVGATNPLSANPGTIRGDFCLSVGRNIVHGSDSAESAQTEIGLWFGGKGEVVDWSFGNEEWVISAN